MSSAFPTTVLAATFLLVMAAIAEDTPAAMSQASEAGLFQVTFRSELQPLSINRMHNWVLHVARVDGSTVADAAIEVGGGMPDHDHGLPSQPRVTRYLGDGDYLVEGMKFHMHGAWEVTFTIRAAAESDRVVFNLEL